jgi:hypothetical protein
MSDRVLKVEDVDRVGQALLTLTMEVWVLRDRQRILEAALEKAGVLTAAAIDTYEPSDELKTSLRDERHRLIDSILDTLTKPPLEASHR